jgi:DNA-directed RNA polymerase specialized sigma subunit
MKGLIVMEVSESDKIVEWQKTKNPELFAELVVRYQPIVNSVVNKYKTWGISPPTLRANANTQVIKALQTYKPTGGAAPSTHIWNNLQKVQRLAGGSLQSGHIPESRNMKRITFQTVRENMVDQLGYEPNSSQMADELGWDVREVARMESELGGETTASDASFDFYGNSTVFENKDKALADYLYLELDDRDKTIFEHSFGYAGKQKLNNKEIAQRLGTNEMAITRARKRMADKIRSYR